MMGTISRDVSHPNCAVEPADHAGKGSAHQVIGKRPEIAFHPDFLDGLVFSERDHRRDRPGIGCEVSDGGQAQQQRDGLLAWRSGYFQVIHVVGHTNGECARAEVERDLDRAGTVAIETLHQDGRGPQDHGLGKAQFQYSQQDKQEVYRHRAGNPGQTDLEPCSQNRDQQVANELRDVPAGGIDGTVQDHTRARHDDQADKHLGAYAQFSPRLRDANHVPPLITL